MRMFKTMFFSSSSFLFGPLSFFCDAMDWPDAKTEEGKGLEDRIASFTRCLKYTWSQSTFNILKDWLLNFWWDGRGGEAEGEGVGVFSSKQTYNYTKELLKKLILEMILSFVGPVSSLYADTAKMYPSFHKSQRSPFEKESTI